MNKRKKRIGILPEILFTILLAGLLGMMTYRIVNQLGNLWFEGRMNSDSYVYQKCVKKEQSLQEYVAEEEVTLEDIDLLKSWCQENKVSLGIYDGKQEAVYDIYSFDSAGYVLGQGEAMTEEEFEDTREIADDVFLLALSDGQQCETLVYYDGLYSYYNVLYPISLCVSFAVSFLAIILMVLRKVHYLRQIVRELSVLKGGDFESPITEKGSDEIYEIAYAINQMRLMTLKREQEEEKIQKMHRSLITALSHDLRTPMTSLIGYLEILKLQPEASGEQKEIYIDNCYQKAFQVKNMIDKLFEYSLISSRSIDDYHMIYMTAAEVAGAIHDSQLQDFLCDGWQVEHNLEQVTSARQVCLDPDYFCRVLDNLVSNIRKYADKEKPICIRVEEEKQDLKLTFTNTIRVKPILSGSTGVGLRTCESIMTALGGEIRREKTETIFRIILILPLTQSLDSNQKPEL